jgi:Tol biopolymer transport system component
VIDGDRLGVSSLDGNPPTPVSGPGYVNGVAYDAEGALVYAQRSGQEPGFYRVEDGVPRLIIPLPWNDPGLPAKWSPDASRAAWIESDGEASELVLAAPGEEQRRVELSDVTDFLWSPDGKQILAWEGWVRTNTYIIDFETGEVTSTALEGLPVAWAPSGDIVVSQDISEPTGCVRQFAVAHPDGTGTSALGNIVLCTEGTPSSMSALSPDGKWLAWGRVENAQGQRDNLVAVAATDGSTTAALKCGAACSPGSSGYGPVWSSDGEQIAWNQDGHILLADTGTWEGRVVGEGYVISWSPNDSAIVYVQRKGDTNAVFELSLKDGEQTKVVDLTPFSGPDVQVAWSPDGQQLAVPLQTSDKADLFSLDLQSGDLQRLPIAVKPWMSGYLTPDGSAIVLYTSDGWTVYGFDGSSRDIPCRRYGWEFADWSQDGRLALCAGPAGLQTEDLRDGQVVGLMEGSAESARLSPDKTAVAFAQGSGKHRLSVLNTVTGEVRELATDLRDSPAPYYYSTNSYAWSPDGKWIAFTNWRSVDSSADPGASTISIIGADAENLRHLVDSPGYKRDLVFSPDGRYLAYTDSTGIVAVNVATGEETTVAAAAWDATIWVNASSLLVHGPRGVSIVGVDGSAQLILAVASGCGPGVIGWHEGKLFFTYSCSHQGP